MTKTPDARLCHQGVRRYLAVVIGVAVGALALSGCSVAPAQDPEAVTGPVAQGQGSTSAAATGIETQVPSGQSLADGATGGATQSPTSGQLPSTVAPEGHSGGADPSDARGASDTETSASEGTLMEGPTEEVAAPQGGDITEVVEAGVQEVLPEVDVTEDLEIDGGYEVSVLELSAANAEARVPGEIGGPAVRVEVRLTNNSKSSVDLGAVTVGADDADETPLSPLGSDPAEPFFGDLEPGDSAEAVYLFSLPEGSATPVTVSVSPAPEAPRALFVGELS